jgi:colicin import membrane protein
MNATAVYSPSSYKIPASALALAVHLLFFTLLYFGVTWQNRPTPVMSVELWQQLPAPVPRPKVVTPPVAPVVIEEVPPAPPPVVVTKPDIVIPEKVEPPPKPVVKKVEPIKPKKIKRTLGKIKLALPTMAKPDPKPEPSKIEQRLEQKRNEQATTRQRLVDEYIGKIVAKIRRNIVMPPNVADNARSTFSVTLLPGGLVLNARLIKSSGNSAYDNATQRAIKKSEPLPLPPNATMFSDFRNLELNFTPKE